MTDEPLIDPALWDAAVRFEATDLTPHVEAINAGVHDLVYRYDPRPARPSPFVEGVTTGYQVMWSGKPGPARLRPVAMLADGDGNVVLEPTGEWQDTTVVDDREET